VTIFIVLLVVVAVIATALVRQRVYVRRERARLEQRAKQKKLAANAAARR
jgi:hypothetical protein